MTENFGNEIWKYVLSEKRLNDVLDWHASPSNNKISKEEEINIIGAMNYDDRNGMFNLWES